MSKDPLSRYVSIRLGANARNHRDLVQNRLSGCRRKREAGAGDSARRLLGSVPENPHSQGLRASLNAGSEPRRCVSSVRRLGGTDERSGLAICARVRRVGVSLSIRGTGPMTGAWVRSVTPGRLVTARVGPSRWRQRRRRVGRAAPRSVFRPCGQGQSCITACLSACL
jgi:hypothetical protein